MSKERPKPNSLLVPIVAAGMITVGSLLDRSPMIMRGIAEEPVRAEMPVMTPAAGADWQVFGDTGEVDVQSLRKEMEEIFGSRGRLIILPPGPHFSGSRIRQLEDRSFVVGVSSDLPITDSLETVRESWLGESVGVASRAGEEARESVVMDWLRKLGRELLDIKWYVWVCDVVMVRGLFWVGLKALESCCEDWY